MRYTKPPLTFQQQINLLKQRGITFSDEIKAKNFLSHVNYYKLSGYFKFFEKGLDNYNSVDFQEIIDLYYFDRELRSHLMKATEKVEVSIKTKIAYALSHKYKDSFVHTSSSNFMDVTMHAGFLRRLKKEERISRELFIKQYKNKYTSEQYTPIWISLEILPFGNISKMYENMSKRDQKNVSKEYNLSPTVLKSWLHNLTLLRNFCAHNSKIWNRKFNLLSLRNPTWNNLPYKWDKLSGQLYIIKYFILEINPKYDFRDLHKCMRKFFRKYPRLLRHMGFNSKIDLQFLIKK